MIKDKLPDKGNPSVQEGGNFEDTLRFLIQNLEEMNLLWIRLLFGVEGNSKKQREKEREELKILIGESINKLSSLESLSKDIYEEQILPKLLKIIINSKDVLSQQYLMECIIHSFPNSYNIKCIEQILDTMTQLKEEVDICSLFINLMEKIGKYFGDYKDNINNINNNDLNDIIETAKNVYPVLLNNFEVIINKNINKEKEEENDNKNNKNNNINNIPLFKLLELICSFLKFSIKCSPEEQKYNSINKIISYTILIINKSDNKKNDEENKKIFEILMTPIEGCFNIFKINDHYKLFELLNFPTKKNFSIELINYLVEDKNIKNINIPKINSIEDFQNIIKYIQPLISDNNNNNNQNENIYDTNIEEEQNIVCKLLYIINSSEPEIIYEIFVQFKNIFSYGGQLRRKFCFPSLVNAIIIFCHKLILSYQDKKYFNIDINKITNNEIFYKLILNLSKLLKEIIDLIVQENANIAFNLFILCSSLINEISIEKEKFSEICFSFINKALELFEIFPELNKVNLIQYLSSNFINYKILTEEQQEKIINIFIKLDEEFENREEQFNLMLIISKLYYHVFQDGKRVNECLIKARRFADFDMTINKNVFLYINLMNHLIYFKEKENDKNNIVEIKKEQIEDLIELIKGHINIIKKNEQNNINDVELYFLNTINTLKKRKNHNNEKLKEFYQSINI